MPSSASMGASDTFAHDLSDAKQLASKGEKQDDLLNALMRGFAQLGCGGEQIAEHAHARICTTRLKASGGPVG